MGCWRHGKLGLGDEADDTLVPTLVRGELQNKTVVQVAVGDEHSTCVTGDGSVYTWGSNEENQLGVVDAIDTYLPVLVQALDINAIE